MAEELKKDKLFPREMTYRVGWSKGTITAIDDEAQRGPPQQQQQEQLEGQQQSPQRGQQPSAGAGSAATAARCRDFTYRGLHRDTFAERLVWRALPAVPARWTTVLLWGAPAAGFALTYALVLGLTRAP